MPARSNAARISPLSAHLRRRSSNGHGRDIQRQGIPSSARVLCVRSRALFDAVPQFEQDNRRNADDGTSRQCPVHQPLPLTGASALVDRRDDDVGVEADHSSSKYFRSSIGIGGCSGRPSGRKSAPPYRSIFSENSLRSIPSLAYRLQQHAASEPADANLLAGQAEFLRQAHRLAAAVLEDFGGAGFGHLRALMIDTNGIYHSETAAAMLGEAPPLSIARERLDGAPPHRLICGVTNVIGL